MCYKERKNKENVAVNDLGSKTMIIYRDLDLE